jgi:hypothetical protein
LDIPTATYTKRLVPVQIGNSASQAFNNCTGPIGPVTITPVGEPYHVYAISVTKLANTDLGLSPVLFDVVSGPCMFTITGDAPGFYNNTGKTLTLRPAATLPVPPLVAPAPMTVGGATAGCAGVVKNGDMVTLTATYTLAPATLAINASQP